jgi:hypothetical protein
MTDARTWSCFSKLWSEDALECTRGFDLAYRNPTTGSNLRGRCSAFEDCKRAKQENRVTYPAANLVRPPPVPQHTQYVAPPTNAQRPPPPPPPGPPQGYAHPPAAYPPAGYTPHYAQPAPPQYYPPPSVPGTVHPYFAQYGPAYVPVPYQQQGAQIPGYLAVPEPVDGASFWARLVVEILRSMAKAGGHAIASFFDHNPLRLHKPPPPPPAAQPQQPR